MLAIPFKALKIGAEAINQNPVKYNKSRISGSKKTIYTLHIRGASMPGEKEKFTVTRRNAAIALLSRRRWQRQEQQIELDLVDLSGIPRLLLSR